VLDCLRACVDAGVGGEAAEQAWRRGLRYYAGVLIEPDGTPRYSPGSRYPIDGQCVAQAIQTLSLAAHLQPEVAELRWAVLDFALRNLTRSDGALVFQRERYWVNRRTYPRWVEAPMLAALSRLLKPIPSTVGHGQEDR
jgi:hypothetical protein